MRARSGPIFIPGTGGHLYAMAYAPRRPRPPGIGIVICEPFAEEKLWAQRPLVNLASALSEEGYWVLAPDCHGSGDSAGFFEESSVETRLADIETAMGFLKAWAPVGVTGYFGLRFGGTLAALAAAKDPDAGCVLLWNPILHGERYFLECLRSNLATQMTTHKKVVKTREQMVQDLLRGELVSIDGYLIARDLYRQIAGIDLLANKPVSQPPSQIVQIARGGSAPDKDLLALRDLLERTPGSVEFVQVAGEAFWKETKHYHRNAGEAVNATLGWLERQFATAR